MNHHEGSLVRALTVFAQAGVNLTRIESRPLPDTPWEYLFFVDVEGRQDGPALAGALLELRACCTHLRLLGSYPCRTRRQDAHLDQDLAPAAVRPGRIQAEAPASWNGPGGTGPRPPAGPLHLPHRPGGAWARGASC